MRFAVALVALAAATSARAAQYVDDAGRVAYRSLAGRDRARLDGYLRALALERPGTWPRNEQIAFWLNAYNAAIVKGVLDGNTAEGLLARYRFFSRFTLPVGAEMMTPDRLERRARSFGEPRVHFALVCASSSCPRLRRRAWRGETLEPDLDEEAARFVRDPLRNELLVGAPEIRLSMIFDWYRDDFGRTDDAVRAWVARYVDEPERRWLERDRPPVGHLEYDWTLNAQDGQRPQKGKNG
jgi:hypothetical protein